MSMSSGTKTALGEAASWIAAGGCLLVAYFYFDELKAAFSPRPASQVAATSAPRTNGAKPRQAPQVIPDQGNRVELTAGQGGHYRAAAHINGREIDVLVDTGATSVALTWEDAERAGVFVNSSDFKYKSRTANGFARIAVVELDRVAIGDIEVRNVHATVHEAGKLHVTLLGMSFLGQLRRAEMQRGRMILEN